ncbi:hypothetical protein MNBD_GAMMA23-2538 [hydrothermal vent metagenome]|uniref:TauD/TfdA-like domain-containing protein n=1 Tax=hydrothermal vent metagenome TaxID=652676 RepID=A0A3B1ANX2_9ZZZZ
MTKLAVNTQASASPFYLESNDLYQAWRDRKLTGYPQDIGNLVVEINDPRKLTKPEYQALLQHCRKTNMVIYASKTGTNPDPDIPLSIGRYFGEDNIDDNWLADDSGLTSLTVATEGVRQHYIPYTNRAINWHTDGYYNTNNKQINALLLHVVQRAAKGGENALLDHEIAYIMLREKNPDYIRALMAPKVLTIPARIEAGKIARAEESGPVFSISENGNLHMRYTIRVNNVIWSNDALTIEALNYLKEILNSLSSYIFRGLLEPGMGLISNNVLHDRTAFTDSETHKRHLYRARYFNRLNDTGVLDN